MLEIRLKRWLFGLVGLAVVILILLLIFGFLVLLIPIVVILIVIGLILGLLRKATRGKADTVPIIKSTKSSKHAPIDVEYKVKEEK